MKISVIIAYYKNLPALELILNALNNQSHKRFEAIIAEDDNNEETKLFYANYLKKFNFDLKHVFQVEDKGFRKNEILNKAIAQSTGNALVFLDGDCIPHKHWLATYATGLKDNIALFGRRVMLSDRATSNLLNTKQLHDLSFFKLLFKGCSRLKYSIYIPFFKSKKKYGVWGCNWGILKKHLVEINGYDENYVTAGVGEDVDIENRLMANGVQLYSVRQAAIVYHLHHISHYNDSVVHANIVYFKKKNLAKEICCENGLDKHMRNIS